MTRFGYTWSINLLILYFSLTLNQSCVNVTDIDMRAVYTEPSASHHIDGLMIGLGDLVCLLQNKHGVNDRSILQINE